MKAPNREQTATLQTALLHRRRGACGPRCEPLSGAPFQSRGLAVAAAWESTYGELRRKLLAAGAAARLYLVFGLQGAGKSTWVACHAPRMGVGAVFLDGPLPSRRHRSRALGIAREVGCEAVAVWVNTPLDVARSRNAGRRGLACIREEATLHVLEHIEAPTLEEGFAEIIEVLPE